MARHLRIEFAGALYHVTARGNATKNTNINFTSTLLILLLNIN